MKKLKSKDDDYEDSGLSLVDKPTIYIPRFLEDLMEDINEAKNVSTLAEFSIFVKADIKGFDITLSRDYYIPKQEVHPAEVEYKEVRPNEDFNTVIHRHPDSLEEFSTGDDTYINRNFDVSLLWTHKNGFVKAQYNLYMQRQRCAIDCDIIVVRPEITNIKGINKIQKYVYKSSYTVVDDKKPNSASPKMYSDNYWGKSYNNGYTRDHINSWENQYMKGSMILNENGELEAYETATTDKDDVPSAVSQKDEEFALSWTNYFNRQYPDKTNEAETLSIGLASAVDEIDIGYAIKNEAESMAFLTWTTPIAYLMIINDWSEGNIKTFRTSLAKEWVEGDKESVVYRVKTLITLFFKNKEYNTANKENQNANSGNSTKSATANSTTH